MKNIKLLLLFSFFATGIFAQTNAVIQKTRMNHVNKNSNESVESFDLEKRLVIHQAFYNENWRTADLLGKDNKVQSGMKVKYDILNQELNVLLDNTPMVAPNKVLSGFVFTDFDQKFVCIKPKNWNKKKAFFEVIEEGNYTLLRYHYGQKQKADYNPNLDIGSKSERIVEKSTFYLLKGGSIYEIPTKKKAAGSFFKEHKALSYLKRNKVNFKNLDDLKGIVQFLNSEIKN